VIRHVELTDGAKKQLRKVPRHVSDKLLAWITIVQSKGLDEVRKQPGYHDEPLKGDRKGQRSIRLSKAYRAIYVIEKGEVSFVSVEEVSKHDY
jgi:toxin HigB-1